MTVLLWVVIGANSLAIVLSSLRWLRVSQREHYLTGSASRFAWRWWRCDPFNAVAAIIGAVALGIVFAVPITGLVVAVLVVLGPRGLTIRGRTSRLAWTRRVRTLAATVAVLIIAIAILAAFVGGLRGSAVVLVAIAALIPLLFDVALWLLSPLERLIGARYVNAARRRLSREDLSIVAITGSYGKTSTKGYLAHLLQSRLRVLASPASFNNQAGLARTVNERLVSGTQVLIAEMGTYGPGEIAAMCAWLPPEVAVITAIGPVHLERFKSLEKTLAAKSEIAESARVVVLNIDDEFLNRLAVTLARQNREVVRCSGIDRAAPVAAILEANVLEVLLDGQSIGQVQVDEPSALAPSNVACAIGAALALGSTPEELLAGLSSLPIASHRLEAITGASGALIIDDTFNSNPLGTRLALRRLEAAGTNNHRRVVVSPGMVELGPVQYEENKAFARASLEIADEIVIVGRTNRAALRAGAHAAMADAVDRTVVEVADRPAAVAYLAARLGPGDVVLYENDLPDHYP